MSFRSCLCCICMVLMTPPCFFCGLNRSHALTCRPAGAGQAVAGQALAHGAAPPLRCDHLGAVGQQLALHLVADGHSVVTDAPEARLRVPRGVVPVDLPVHRAARRFLLICSWDRRTDDPDEHTLSGLQHPGGSRVTLPGAGSPPGDGAGASDKHTGQHSPSGVPVL